MDILLFIVAVIGAIVVFDVVALAFGADSRPAMRDEGSRMWRI